MASIEGQRHESTVYEVAWQFGELEKPSRIYRQYFTERADAEQYLASLIKESNRDVKPGDKVLPFHWSLNLYLHSSTINSSFIAWRAQPVPLEGQLTRELFDEFMKEE